MSDEVPIVSSAQGGGTGMYGMIFGQNPATAMLLLLAGFRPPVPAMRLRDSWLERHEEGVLIHIYTRMGGGNRADYAATWLTVRAMPSYVRDADDSFDSTYASIWLRPDWPGMLAILESPEEVEKAKATVAEVAHDPVDTAANWQQMIDALANAAVDAGAKPGDDLEVAIVEIRLDDGS